ncbi:xylulokinase [Spirochaetia bacterium]|nr:xylulokinase [Spirochaetia bacterium]
MVQHIMGLDLGTSSLKIALLTERAEIRFVRSLNYPSCNPRPSWIEQDPAEYGQVLAKLVSMALEEVPASSIAAVGFSGHMSAPVLVDDKGRPLVNCLTISDNRSMAESLEINRKAGERIFENTGNPVINAFTAPKLLWLMRNREDAFRKAAAFISPKDYLRFLLGGSLCAEHTDAANSLLLDRDGAWDWDLIDKLGFPRHIFPEILGSPDAAGTVSIEAAKRFGLVEGTPLLAGAADMACAALGTGVFRPPDAAVTIGTSATFLCAVSDLPAPNSTARGKVTYHPHAAGGHFALGSHFSGGLAVNWLGALLSPGEQINYSLIDELAEKAADIEQGNLLCLPFLSGSGTPYFSSADGAAFIGLDQTSNKAILLKSLLEGIAFNLRQSLEIFEAVNGGPLDDIIIAGGGSRIKGWSQIITDIFERKTREVRCPDASAVGAAVLAGYGAGIFSNLEEPALGCLVEEKQYLPNERRARHYEKIYGLWKESHDVLAKITGKLKEPEKI